MKLLCIDTSGSYDSIALTEDKECVFEHFAEHTKIDHPKILDNIQEMMKAVRWSWSDIEGISVGLGPGGFTRLRTGLAVAKALSYGLDRPLFGASSLTLIGSAHHQGDPVVLTDAGRNECYFFTMDQKVRCGCLDDLQNAYDTQGSWLFCGSGARKHAQQIKERFPHSVINDNPDLDRASARLLATIIDENQPLDLATAQPNYVRPSDAELTYPNGFPDAATQFKF